MEKYIKGAMNVVKETELAKIVIESFYDVIKPFTEKFLKLDLMQLAELYNDEVDNLILKEEQQKNLKYVGGEFKIYYMDDDYFGTSISLYFQDRNKQWVKTSAKSKPQKMAYLKQEAIITLKNERTVAFEIEPPKKEPVENVDIKAE